MTTAEKVKNKQPITREEFQALVKKTDWDNYRQRVANRVFDAALLYEQASKGKIC